MDLAIYFREYLRPKSKIIVKKKQEFSSTFMSIICRAKWLNPVTCTNSDRPRKIVQVNTLHVLYDFLFLKIFEFL